MTAEPTTSDLATQIVEAAEPFADWLGDDEAQGDGLDLDRTYKEAVIAALDAIASARGLLASVGHDGASTYIDIEQRSDEGSDVLCQVRVSNHDQRWSGPIWSFEPGNDEQSVRQGLERIIATIDEEIDDA